MRILLVGESRLNNLEAFVSNAFERQGHHVEFLGYSTFLPASSKSWAMASTRFFGPTFDLWSSLVLRRFQLAVVEAASRFDPDLTLVFKGNEIAPSVVSRLRSHSSAPVALWFPDDPRFFATFLRWVAPAYDNVFTYTMRGLARYRSLGIPRVFCVPFGCDPSVHRILYSVPQHRADSDILFVGTYTPRRARFLRELERAGFRPEVYGPYWTRFNSKPNYHPPIYGDDLARLCFASKITLNFHTVSGWGPNMRVFESTACGGFLLTDDCDEIGRYYIRGRELEVFRNSKELCAKIRYFLNNETQRDEIAKSGYRRAHNDHTYDIRVQSIVKYTLSNLSS